MPRFPGLPPANCAGPGDTATFPAPARRRQQHADRHRAADQGVGQIDPAAAQRIHPNDPQRIQRALEVIELSGRPLSDLHDEQQTAGPGCRVLRVVAFPQPRAVLHQRIEQRFDAMLAAGFLDEVRALSDRIAVVFGGEIMGIVENDQTTVEELGLMMAGEKRQAPEAAGGPLPSDTARASHKSTALRRTRRPGKAGFFRPVYAGFSGRRGLGSCSRCRFSGKLAR